MRLLAYVALTAALAAPVNAGELDFPKDPAPTAPAQRSLSDAIKRDASLLTPAAAQAYSQADSWQRRVSRSRGTGGSTKRAVIIGAIAGGAAGFLTGLTLENVMCECGPGPVSGGLTAAGAGAGAAIGWAVSLR